MRLWTTIGALCCICGITLWGCSTHRFERHVVFGGPASTRIDRVRQYSLEDQYKVFRYGNDVVEPPLFGLAKPIAERGATAIPFLLKKLNAEPDDTTVRDILLIFQEMAFSKSYDVKADAVLMGTLDTRVTAMKDKEWQSVCSRMLRSIKGEQASNTIPSAEESINLPAQPRASTPTTTETLSGRMATHSR